MTLLTRTWTITRMKALAIAGRLPAGSAETIRGLVYHMQTLVEAGNDGDATTLCFLMIVSLVRLYLSLVDTPAHAFKQAWLLRCTSGHETTSRLL